MSSKLHSCLCHRYYYFRIKIPNDKGTIIIIIIILTEFRISISWAGQRKTRFLLGRKSLPKAWFRHWMDHKMLKKERDKKKREKEDSPLPDLCYHQSLRTTHTTYVSGLSFADYLSHEHQATDAAVTKFPST